MLIDENNIFLETNFKNKREVFEFLSDIAMKHKVIKKRDQSMEDLFEREKQISTGLEDSFSIPHCRSENVISSSVFYIRNLSGIEWETLDNSEVKYIIAIFVPKVGTENSYLQIIANIATNLLEEDFKNLLKQSNDKKEILYLLNKESNK